MNHSYFYPELGPLVDGDAVVALFLSQVIYWHGAKSNGKPRFDVVDKGGHYWLAKSSKEWEQETLLTRKQVARCVKILSDTGIIRTKVMRWKGAPTLHFQLVCLDGKHEPMTAEGLIEFYLGSQKAHSKIPKGQYSKLPKGTKQNSPKGNIPKSQKEQYTTITIQETIPVTIQGGSLSLPDPSDDLETEEAMAKTKSSADEILSKFKLDKTKGTPSEKLTPTGMYDTWKVAVVKYQGVKFVPAFTGAELGQMGRLIKSWGVDAQKVLLLILKEWVPFTKYAKAKAGAFPLPDQPTVWFVVKYQGVAMNYFVEDSEANCTKKPVIPKGVVTIDKTVEAVTMSKPAEPPVEQQATLDDILEAQKWLAGKGKAKKS